MYHELNNLLDVGNRDEFRKWLENNHATQRECWVELKRGRPADDGKFYYIDALEEAICFGWIDSTLKVVDGRSMQRFSPRRRGSNWTELNKERARRLEKLGMMTDSGRKVLPEMGPRSFVMDEEIKNALKEARVWSAFIRFHPLYRRIRIYNLVSRRSWNYSEYEKALERLIQATREGKTIGQWNDYGRLLDY